jgi:hypothetical protein
MFEYNSSYTRGVRIKWADSLFGPVGLNRNGKIPAYSLTGYDLCDFLRTWLTDNGHEGRSVCEVLLEDPKFGHLRRHTRSATIFYSHTQRLAPLWTLDELREAQKQLKASLPEEEGQFFWMDYFCLRQCQNDFKNAHVIGLIKQIGLTVAEIDNTLEYLRRSFCILELYATIAAESTLLCQTHLDAEEMEEQLTADPVNSKAAQTRSAEHKIQIDRYIEGSIGFQAVDEAVHRAALEGGQAWDDNFLAEFAEFN